MPAATSGNDCQADQAGRQLKKELCTCEGGAGEDAKVLYKYGGKAYTSPWPAGSAVIGGACSGWRFWSPEGQEVSAREGRAASGEPAFPAGTAANDVFIVEGRQELYGTKSAWEVVVRW